MNGLVSMMWLPVCNRLKKSAVPGSILPGDPLSLENCGDLVPYSYAVL